MFPLLPLLSRREALRSISAGFGYLALTSLLTDRAAAGSSNPLLAKSPMLPARAKRVIFMFNQGGPSHVDTFDYKPALTQHDGQSPGEVHSYKGGDRKLMKSPFKFSQHGKSGLWISELFPHLAQHADELCLLNSMHTGSFQFVRPSVGSWVLYGLGTENSELPGFITLNPLNRVGGAQNYGSAFLPAAFQGTRIGGEGTNLEKAGIPNLRNAGISPEMQRQQLDYLQDLNHERLEADKVNTELEGLIESYELAFRMQGAVPRLMDISNESSATQEAYGLHDKSTDSFGRQCLLARRFAEAGVRFIELSTAGWDQHRNLRSALTK
ncbi:MAG TPA: DUF1501 domain-containing protein, partial [Pirellulales bacterium]|nr:DUF1501 domain-containing protein [Pirellulales bacterium]